MMPGQAPLLAEDDDAWPSSHDHVLHTSSTANEHGQLASPKRSSNYATDDADANARAAPPDAAAERCLCAAAGDVAARDGFEATGSRGIEDTSATDATGHDPLGAGAGHATAPTGAVATGDDSEFAADGRADHDPPQLSEASADSAGSSADGATGDGAGSSAGDGSARLLYPATPDTLLHSCSSPRYRNGPAAGDGSARILYFAAPDNLLHSCSSPRHRDGPAAGGGV